MTPSFRMKLHNFDSAQKSETIKAPTFNVKKNSLSITGGMTDRRIETPIERTYNSKLSNTITGMKQERLTSMDVSKDISDFMVPKAKLGYHATSFRVDSI